MKKTDDYIIEIEKQWLDADLTEDEIIKFCDYLISDLIRLRKEANIIAFLNRNKKGKKND